MLVKVKTRCKLGMVAYTLAATQPLHWLHWMKSARTKTIRQTISKHNDPAHPNNKKHTAVLDKQSETRAEQSLCLSTDNLLGICSALLF
jgi:hypothetical protein